MFTYCNGGVLPQNPILTLHFNKLVGAVYNRLNFDAVLRARTLHIAKVNVCKRNARGCGNL